MAFRGEVRESGQSSRSDGGTAESLAARKTNGHAVEEGTRAHAEHAERSRPREMDAVDAARPSGYPQSGTGGARVEDEPQTSVPITQIGATPSLGRLGTAVRSGRVHRSLALADSLAIVFAITAASLVDRFVAFSSAPDHPVVVAVFAVFAWLVIGGLDGVFHVDDRRIDCSTSDEIFTITRTVGLWIWIVFGIDALLTSPGAPSVSEPIFISLVAIPTILLTRGLTRWVIRKQAWYAQRVVIVGTDADRERVRRTVERHPEYGLKVVGETESRVALPGIPDHTDQNGEEREPLHIDPLIALVVERDADRVIFGSAYHPALEERTEALRFLAEHAVHVDIVPGDSDAFRIDAELHHIEGLPLVTLPFPHRPRYASAVKRGVDVVVAAAALLLLSPLLAACALAIRLDSPGTVFFRQPRVGRNRATFSVFKFRTMVIDAEELKPGLAQLNQRDDRMFKIPEDPRITRVGRWLRRYSLDELPQLVNVLRGEMSLVGPRPLIAVEADLVDRRYEARFEVRPGITGPWQVFGRSDIPFDDMVKLDYTYVTNWSVGYDVKLMARTLSAMLAGRGAY
jgi:exopolysaccharide biosynthesis polyprenyl glycosylphosphotransferase